MVSATAGAVARGGQLTAATSIDERRQRTHFQGHEKEQRD